MVSRCHSENKEALKVRPKIIRVSTAPITLDTFCEGLFRELSKDYEIVAVSSPGEALDKIARREKVRCVAVPMERRISVWHDLVSLIRLVRVFHKERPQMVHSMTPKAGLLSMLAAWIVRVPVRVHTFTGLVFPTSTGLRRRLLMFTDSVTCFCATHVVPEGEGVKDDLYAFGITRKPMEVLGYGNVRGINLTRYDRTPEVNEAAAKIREQLHLAENSFVFLFVGRLLRDKGIGELMRAFSRLSQSGRGEVHLILVGREEFEIEPVSAQVRNLIDSMPNVHAVGEQEDVRPWYAVADAFVLPSYREGFPNAVIEAGAMGLPSIVTDVNGAREIIIHKENGLIIPPKDEDSLYKAMAHLIDFPDEAKAMGMKARPLIASRYEQGFVRDCLKRFYKSLLRRSMS